MYDQNVSTLRIINGMVVLPEGISRVDLFINKGKIEGIDSSIKTGNEVFDAAGYIIIPGVIDDQVHFREPGFTHKEDIASGSAACAAGGVTTYLEMPNTSPAATTIEKVESKYKIAEKSSLVNYGFYIGATKDNVQELKLAKNIPGIKIFVGSSTGDLLVDNQDSLEEIFSSVSLPITAHCEDEFTIQENKKLYKNTNSVKDHSNIRDRNAAIRATRRMIDLSHNYKKRFHLLHISTAEEVEMILDHRSLITGEACMHHFHFTTEDYERLGTRIQMNPSVKEKADVQAIWNGLLANKIQIIATDHAPHTLEEKNLNYPHSPSGLPAVENSLGLMLDRVNKKMCTIEQVVHWMSEAPARTWGLVGKGKIALGYDADLAIIDLNRSHQILDSNQITKSKWSPWSGKIIKGQVIRTYVGGKLVWSDGIFDYDIKGSRVKIDHGTGGYWETT